VSVEKTDLDCRREHKANLLNEELLGTWIDVSSGGRWGPYQVTVKRLNEPQMRELVRRLKAILQQVRCIS